jgi:DNA-binding IclR family transcriptional regulator
MGEKIVQSPYLITCRHDESTPDPIDVEGEMTQLLCSGAGLVYVSFCDERRRKLTMNTPRRSSAEVSLPASERLETMIAPDN